jgi:type II secretory pathway component PulF
MPKQMKPARKKSSGSLLSYDISIGGVDMNQRVLFAKNLSVMIKSGLTVDEALHISADAATGKFRYIINDILAAVESGRTLSDALRQHPNIFSQLFVNSVYAGEASGTLEANLEYVAEQLRKDKELTMKIKGAMLYPTVVIITAFIMSMGISFYILPKLTPMFASLKIELPLSTRMLLWFTNFIELHGASLLYGIIIAVLALTWFMRQKFSRPLTNYIALKTPIIRTLTRNSNIARFCRTLGTLIKSGLTIEEATAISAETAGNYYYSSALGDVSQRMKSGSGLSENMQLHEKLFPKFMIGMIRVGETSGRLDEVLLYLASYFEDEVNEDTKNLATAIEPVLLLGIGLMVGFLALSIITPIYNITGNLNH